MLRWLLHPRGCLRIAVLAVLIALVGCAHTRSRQHDTLPPLRLAPVALGQELALQQQLTFRFGRHVQQMDALLEVDASAVRLMVQAMGQAGVNLVWDGQVLNERRADWLPPMVRGERVLDDLQFALWPADAIRAALPQDWTLHEETLRRELRQAGKARLLLERLADGSLRLSNPGAGYQLTIKSVASGDGDPA